MKVGGYLVALVLFGSALAPRVFSLEEEAPAIEVALNGPSNLALEGDGHLFVVEMLENKVLRIDLRAGTITTVAGGGAKVCCDQGNLVATELQFDFIKSIAVDSAGNLFIGEFNRVFRVDSKTGLVSPFAGDGETGNTDSGSAAVSAHFWGIDGLAVDARDNLLITDPHQGRIFEVDAHTGAISTVAGKGFGFAGDGGPAAEASFSFAESLALDKAQSILIADFGNCRIRRIDHATRIVQSIAVTDTPQDPCTKIGNSRPGPFPSDVAVDSRGNIYFVEGAMDIVERVDSTSGRMSVVAGTGERGFSGDGGLATQAMLSNPSGLAVDQEGNLFISEYLNNRIRRVDARTGIITTIAGNGLPHRADVQL